MKYMLSCALWSAFFISTFLYAEECQRSDCSFTRRPPLPKNKKCNVVCSTTCYDCGTTTFIPRSQGANTARELIGWQSLLYKPFLIENYAVLGFTAEYTRSFRDCHLARRLFCTDCLTFSGSQATNRANGSEIIADHFGLPPNFRGTLAIRPFIENYIIDISFYFGLDEFLKGLYMRVHAPITHTRWSLDLDECIACDDKFRGSDTFPRCYMLSENPPDPNTDCFVHNAVNPLILANDNCTTHSIREALSGNFTFGDMRERWDFGRFDFCPRSKTGLADLDIIFGLNLMQSDFGHFGFFGQVVIPTGNTPKAKYIFEPLTGNGGHIELGGGISGHLSLFSDYCHGGRHLGLYFEGNITHLFKHSQKRSFDFRNNGLLSRYMLLKEFDINNQYLGRLINAINFATRTAEVRIPYKADASVKVAFGVGGWTFDVGYNIYARAREEVRIETECPCDIDQRRFGIKGITGVCCINYAITNGQVIPFGDEHNSFRTDNTTQPNASMFTVTPLVSGTLEPEATNVCLTYNSTQVTNSTPVSRITPRNGYIIINAEAPVIISCADLDPNSAAQCAMVTHKVFSHISYMWFNYCYNPYIGLGAEVEFDGSKAHNALNQWGVWLKGGISF